MALGELTETARYFFIHEAQECAEMSKTTVTLVPYALKIEANSMPTMPPPTTIMLSGFLGRVPIVRSASQNAVRCDYRGQVAPGHVVGQRCSRAGGDFIARS